MELRIWAGFLISSMVLLALAQRRLSLGLFAGAITLGLFTLPPARLGSEIAASFLDPPTLLLALAVALIPVIGGGMEESGQMDELVRNMRIGRKAFLALSPSLLGMLPMPGGALFSAPLVEKGGEGLDGGEKAALNVWFRHILFLIYPLTSSLIVSARIAGLEVYRALPSLLPAFVLSLLLGYHFFLRQAGGRMEYEGSFSLTKLLRPLSVILAAPLIDILGKVLFHLPMKEMATLIGVAVSLALVSILGGLGLRDLGRIAHRMKAWDFGLLIVGMIAFVNVFRASGVPRLIGELALPPELLCVGIASLLGLATGRIQAPASIVIPIYLARFGLKAMSPPVFALTYFSTFLGYVISPVHPCVSVSLEYFRASMRDFLAAMLPPTVAAFILCLLAAFALFSMAS